MFLIHLGFLILDATELVLRVIDTETNRVLGTVKIQNLSTLSTNDSIKGYHPIFSNKDEKLGELFVSLRLFLPGRKLKMVFSFPWNDSCVPAHDSSENLTALSYASDTSDPPSRRSSVGVSDFNKVGSIRSIKKYPISKNVIFLRMDILKMVYEHIHSIVLSISSIQQKSLQSNHAVQLSRKMHHLVRIFSDDSSHESTNMFRNEKI